MGTEAAGVSLTGSEIAETQQPTIAMNEGIETHLTMLGPGWNVAEGGRKHIPRSGIWP